MIGNVVNDLNSKINNRNTFLGLKILHGMNKYCDILHRLKNIQNIRDRRIEKEENYKNDMNDHLNKYSIPDNKIK